MITCDCIIHLVDSNEGLSPFSMKEAYLYWIITPYGLCRCGCGKKTEIPSSTKKRSGLIKGVPLSTVKGHKILFKRKNIFIQSFGKNGIIEISEVKNIAELGILPVYQLDLKSGHKIKGCFDQEILTKEGWVSIGDVTPDLNVVILPKPKEISNPNFSQISKLTLVGREMVYGVKVNACYPNYFANGIVVQGIN